MLGEKHPAPVLKTPGTGANAHFFGGDSGGRGIHERKRKATSAIGDPEGT
jgi:hypothetical protein